MRCHGNDRDTDSSFPFRLPDLLCGLDSAHHWHLDVHQDQVERIRLEQLDCFLAVDGESDLMPSLFKQAQRQLLIHAIIFHE